VYILLYVVSSVELKNVKNVHTDFQFIVWKSMGAVNCMMTDILQNNFFCVQQKKETRTGLEQFEDE